MPLGPSQKVILEEVNAASSEEGVASDGGWSQAVIKDQSKESLPVEAPRLVPDQESGRSPSEFRSNGRASAEESAREVCPAYTLKVLEESRESAWRCAVTKDPGLASSLLSPARGGALGVDALLQRAFGGPRSSPDAAVGHPDPRRARNPSSGSSGPHSPASSPSASDETKEDEEEDDEKMARVGECWLLELRQIIR